MWKVQGKQTDVTAVAFDGRYVYWSSQENGQERIMRSREDGSKKEVIVSSGLERPTDMAWDWVTRTLYITDSGSKTVSACTEDGHFCSVMVNAVSDSPHGIVVIPQEG
jgi:DNA-binding beta-propeller fold protein YncE